MMKYLFILSIFTFVSLNVNAETKQEKKSRQSKALNNWQQQLKKDRETIRQMLGVDMFTGFDQRFEKLLEDFYAKKDGDIDKFFEDDQFDQFLDLWHPFDGMKNMDERWIETPQSRILVFKIPGNNKKQSDQQPPPVDIKIEKGLIHISGKTITETKFGNSVSTSTSSFQQVFQVPDDVDANKVEFENKNGEILIKFPKSKIASKKHVVPNKNSEGQENKKLKELDYKKDDIQI